MQREKVAIVGSGNWGSAICDLVAHNVLRKSDMFEPTVTMWMMDEVINDGQYAGQKLAEVFNKTHENVKYLPGTIMPDNAVAETDLIVSVKDATAIIIVIPHQFLGGTLKQLKGHIHPNAKAISLMKGINFKDDQFVLLSTTVTEVLEIPCCALMGANVANQVAARDPAEATIGYVNKAAGQMFQQLFDCETFRVNIVEDVSGVELCGALKNVVAIGAGVSDGLGFQDNTKAAIVRIGLMEMRRFAAYFFPPCVDQTYFESCGVADLVTTCYAGRNRKVAEASVKTGKTFEELEVEMLNGQKLQGTLTSKEVYTVLNSRSLTQDFPLFVTVYQIVYEKLPPKELVRALTPITPSK
jgi:glycerol-3-phosphate dehydrogenase (NAD+)